MNEIIQEIGTPVMLEALEANSGEEMGCFGRGIPGAELHEDEELTWFITHRRYLNGVLRTRLARNEQAYIDAKIEQVRHHFLAQKVGLNWPVGPVTYPTHLGEYLVAHGIPQRTSDLWMALGLHTLDEPTQQGASLTIRECHDQAAMQVWKEVSGRGFNGFEEGVESYYENYLNIGFGDGTSWHHYVAWLNTTPVAAASLLVYAGLAGIYGVSTVPEARRQGVGAAITTYALQYARTLGYHIAVLSPSNMGINMYRRIGFRDVCTVQHYTLSE